MLRYYSIPLLLVLGLIFLACGDKTPKKQPEVRTESMDTTSRNRIKPNEGPIPVPDVESKELFHQAKTKHLTQKTTSSQEQPNSSVPLKSPKNEPSFPNPSLDTWTKRYQKDPAWQALYQSSVVAFLNSAQRNLDQFPQRKTNRSVLVSSYREKMSETFYKSPEFVEYARKTFENSGEFSEFLQRNKEQITEDSTF
jgi:hypothetical protein